jgi:hypothetical protein
VAKRTEECDDEAGRGRELALRLVRDAGHREAATNLDFFVDTMTPSLLEVWMDLAATGPGGLAGEVFFVMYPADRGNGAAAAAFWEAAGHDRPSTEFVRAFIETVAVELK